MFNNVVETSAVAFPPQGFKDDKDDKQNPHHSVNVAGTNGTGGELNHARQTMDFTFGELQYRL